MWLDLRIWGFGFRVRGSGFRFWGSGFRVEGRCEDRGVQVQGSGFRGTAVEEFMLHTYSC